MNTSDIVSELVKKLKDTGLADMAGSPLYSGFATLGPGKLYVLGYNPGGDPAAESDSPAVHLAKLAVNSPGWPLTRVLRFPAIHHSAPSEKSNFSGEQA